MDMLDKDQYGLYINADNYCSCLTNIVISKIIK